MSAAGRALVDAGADGGADVSDGTGSTERVLARVLELAGEQLGMDAAWIARFAGPRYEVQAAHGDAASFGVREGWSTRSDGTYCARMADGRLPNAVPDTSANAQTAGLAITRELGIGAYIGVPLVLSDGSVCGALCCQSHDPDPTLGAKDVKFLSILAQVAVEELEREDAVAARRSDTLARVASALRGDVMRVVYQPIVDLRTMRITAAEALARFDGSSAGPASWFGDAARVGLGLELELAAITRALAGLDALPASVRLSLNASAEMVASRRLLDLLAGGVGARVQLEITERGRIDDYGKLLRALDDHRALGVRVAVDDAAAGYSGLRHILRVAPDVIKLDITLTRDIHIDPAREALTESLVGFADRVGACLVAEGIESQGELDKLAQLGLTEGQGFFLARPEPLPLPPISALPAGLSLPAG
jgi:EAL domain-containing protein (putative c-di-GMP-specific phosphodiesterase class I)